jgi:serine/threonine protein kinase
MALASGQWMAGAELGDRFADVRLLRAGSRFTVYEATDPSTSRPVVVKIPDEHRAHWLHEVLEQEAALLSRVGSHPNVITLYERLHLADGRPALVLERCTSSLEDTLHSAEPLALETVASIGIKLAGALETVHRAGVLHCDVRPRNVLVSEFGEPVLAGFDEAVELGAGIGHAPMHVTTAHTAPELLEGRAPTTASDVYGLASTLYELITGRAAFRAYRGESPAAVIIRVLSGTVKPIVSPDVPIEVSDVLTWAMSPDPAKRPPSPAWLAEEFSRIGRRQGWPRTRMIAR